MAIATIGEEWGPFIGTDASKTSRVDSGYARYALTAVKQLTEAPTDGVTLPAEARHALITVKDQAIRVRCDGVDPTAAEGRYVSAGDTVVLENSPSVLRAWRMVAVT